MESVQGLVVGVSQVELAPHSKLCAQLAVLSQLEPCAPRFAQLPPRQRSGGSQASSPAQLAPSSPGRVQSPAEHTRPGSHS